MVAEEDALRRSPLLLNYTRRLTYRTEWISYFDSQAISAHLVELMVDAGRDIAGLLFYNTIISSEDNEIMYEVLTPNSFINRVTTITRLDKSSGEKVFAGEIAWKATQNRTMVRVGWQSCEWILAHDGWLKNTKGISRAKTFSAGQGAQYRWKVRNLNYHVRRHSGFSMHFHAYPKA
ncbi:hypothetical protein FS837_010104 [Tulasnella sp. UAMH 9824]|nr:hypothetical protein FS837_010104 [Tulasnella sp. UAMH 9824]